MKTCGRLTIAILSAALIAQAQTASAQAADRWQPWLFSAPIRPDAPAGAGLMAATVPLAVTRRSSPAWADLRVVDAAGRETPYVLRSRAGAATDWRAATVVEPSFVAGQFTQVVADAGVQPRVHNSASLQIASSEDFVTWVEIAASDDARAWRVVRERAPIYALVVAGIGTNTTLTYPDTVSRYTRFRLLDGSRRYRVTGVDLAARAAEGVELVPAGFALEASTEAGKNIWVSQNAVPNLPIAGVRFDTAHPEFLRPVVIETSEDGERWQRQASGEIYRMVERNEPRASLDIQFPEEPAAHWRITVYNRSDTPLPDLKPVLQTIPRRVVFRAEPGQSYRLLYSNSRAKRPEYDLARLTDASALDGAGGATLGEPQQNAGYVDSAPWTERHPFVLWSALGIAVMVLVVLAVRTLRTG